MCLVLHVPPFPAVKKLEEQSAEKDRQLADVAAATEAAAEEAKRKAEEEFKSELEDWR